jgi:hypothetical protein
MKPKKFQEANVVYGEGQPEYKPLPAHKTKEGQAISVLNWTKQNEKK